MENEPLSPIVAVGCLLTQGDTGSAGREESCEVSYQFVVVVVVVTRREIQVPVLVLLLLKMSFTGCEDSPSVSDGVRTKTVKRS